MSARIAKRSDCKIYDMPGKISTLDIKTSYSPEEMTLIRRGLIPQQMEDKWFIFCEDNTVYFHRSWSGYCIYRLHLEFDNNIYKIIKVCVNCELKQYGKNDDDYEKALLMYLIDRLLLNKDVSFPIPKDLPQGVPKKLHCHHVVGYARSNNEDISL